MVRCSGDLIRRCIIWAPALGHFVCSGWARCVSHCVLLFRALCRLCGLPVFRHPAFVYFVGLVKVSCCSMFRQFLSPVHCHFHRLSGDELYPMFVHIFSSAHSVGVCSPSSSQSMRAQGTSLSAVDFVHLTSFLPFQMLKNSVPFLQFLVSLFGVACLVARFSLARLGQSIRLCHTSQYDFRFIRWRTSLNLLVS